MQFDRGYLSPYFVTDPQHDELRARRRLHPRPRKEDHAASRTSSPCWKPSSTPASRCLIVAEDIEGEALATLVINKLRGTFNVLRREGPRLRRSPQGHARRHRHPHRRPGHLRRPRHQARKRRPHRARPRQEDHRRQGQHDDHRRRRQERRHQGPHRPDPPRDRQHHQRLRQARSSKSGSRSWPAAWPRSTSAPRPRAR